MKYSNIIIFVILYNLLFQFQYLKGNTESRCSLHKSNADVITTFEDRQFNQSIKIFLEEKLQTPPYCFTTNKKVANLLNFTEFSFNTETGHIFLDIITKRLGGASIKCSCGDKSQNSTFKVLTLIVEREITIKEILFRILILLFVIVITFVMGCSIEMEIVLQYLKKPIGPGIGLLSQYFIMPLLAFGISKAVGLSNEFGFGLLTVGCCPGGSGSNIWTVLLKGDLNLSMTMTFVSTILALAMMPFWMFCLGRYFLDYRLISIPYLYILFNIIQVVVPAILGVLFRWKWETKAIKIIKFTKFLALGFILFLLTFGIYANLYMYMLIFDYPYLIPIAAMLPWLGFLFGFVTGIIFRQGIKKSLTISIEVGIQNIGIAILILKFSMPKPLGDMAAVIPIIVALVTPFPLLFAYFGDLIIIKCIKKQSKKEEFEPSTPDLSDKQTYRMVATQDFPKQSVNEPTLYYSEELSSYVVESSPSLG